MEAPAQSRYRACGSIALSWYGPWWSRPVTAETTDVWLYEPLHSEARPRIRCLIATGALKLGGQEMVALFLARHLPHHGFDTSIAHTPWDRSDEERAGALRLDGVPVVKLAEDTVAEWLSAHRPDVISLHGAADWLVTAAAAARIPMIETLHGAPSFFDQRTLPTEQLRSRDITGFVAVSEPGPTAVSEVQPGMFPGPRHHHSQWGRQPTYRSPGQGPSPCMAWVTRRVPLCVPGSISFAEKYVRTCRSVFRCRACLPGGASDCAGDVVDRPYFEQGYGNCGIECRPQAKFRYVDRALTYPLCWPPPTHSVLDLSFFEGWSMASMEALFTGLPAVLSEVSGAREQVGENGCRGIMVSNPLGDPGSDRLAGD